MVCYILVFIQLKVFSNLPCDFFFDPMVFRHVLLNFHVFMNSQISIFDLEFPCIVVRGHTLHDFNLFPSVESCFMAKHTVHLGEYSMCAWQNLCSVSGAGQKKGPLTS